MVKLACSICCYFFEAKLIKIYDGWHSTSWYFLKVFQILYPITCKCKFHADGQTSTHRNVTDLPPSWCIFTPDIQYIFVVLEAFNSHTRRFWLLHAMYSSYIVHSTQPHCKRRIFCNWREDCSCHYFWFFIYTFINVYKSQTESYKRDKHKNPNKKLKSMDLEIQKEEWKRLWTKVKQRNR